MDSFQHTCKFVLNSVKRSVDIIRSSHTFSSWEFIYENLGDVSQFLWIKAVSVFFLSVHVIPDSMKRDQMSVWTILHYNTLQNVNLTQLMYSNGHTWQMQKNT